ncbi:hypothetical protein [Aliiruegeria sabulilitoris]|uniref:hypothetical protein n=1 Tax=Aliiruegeria sabulilitoris TaxID=1510458 RepID=UPI001E5769B9|nr:hypothetical protein [Aliiruegeria sabulilitoris]
MTLDLSSRRIQARPPFAGTDRGAASQDALTGLRVSHVVAPLKAALSDAKVLTGRQTPLVQFDLLVVEAQSETGATGMGYSYTLRAGGPGMFSLACEIAPRILGEDPNDIGRLWEKLRWQVNSLGRGGMAFQTIAAFDTALWDMKAAAPGCRWPSCSGRIATTFGSTIPRGSIFRRRSTRSRRRQIVPLRSEWGGSS